MTVDARRRSQRQECPFDPDCGWTAAVDDHHAVAAHMREHK